MPRLCWWGKGRGKPGLVMFIMCRMRTLIFNIKFWFTNFAFYTTDRNELNCSESNRKGDWRKLRFCFSVLWRSAVFLVGIDVLGEIVVSVFRVEVSTVKMRWGYVGRLHGNVWLGPWEEERMWSPFGANGSGGQRKWEDGPCCDRCGQDIVINKAPYCITGPIPHFIRFDHEDGGSMFLQNLPMSRKGYDLTAQEVFIKIQTAIETASFSFTDPKRSVVLS